MNPNRERRLHNGDPKSMKNILFLLGLVTSLSAHAAAPDLILFNDSGVLGAAHRQQTCGALKSTPTTIEQLQPSAFFG